MELRITDIVEAAGKIIIESGIDTLSVDKLACEMEINPSQLLTYFRNDDDILIFMLKSLENDIKQLIIDRENTESSPEEDLQILFQNIHELLKAKPYYLPAIFSTELKENNSELHKTLISIKIPVSNYLLKVINHGKKESVFKTRQSSRILATKILGSFRSFMNEQRLINKMAREIKILKSKNEKEHPGYIN